MTVNNHRLSGLLILSVALALIAGCGPSGPVNEKVNAENLKKIEPGIKLADVEALLGPGEPSAAAPSAQPGDGKLTWKKWQHSSRGAEVIIGFDERNEAELVDKKTVK
jgi:hypothetical protein